MFRYKLVLLEYMSATQRL